ncbi:ABC transporter ATP-binding protein [Oricola thermophila]|uniref:ATP-binding cassette domain-containing protein n=1 Tax=Oricola thermophila TaxID=2742145 RepID=A0A6N1VGL1_9HYPH|nr:oligopeptide/dipeptide ABC transporter ATP-binding protein [Oricola thermophila]QKV18299.1 ATP-binding cassette domain-containing protein [Oricola thermophila]
MNHANGDGMAPLLAARKLSKTFRIKERHGLKRFPVDIRAVEEVDLVVGRGEVLGIVGESGCGKTSLARTLLLLERASGGTIELGGRAVDPADRAQAAEYRRAVQMVFQDPYASVNPRMTVAEIVEEPLLLQRPELDRAARQRIVRERLEEVSLGEQYMGRRARGLSGGQLQRIGIARALAVDPSLLICDEPVSALDVSIQAQVLNLLADIRETRGLSMVFISHDLSVVRQVCDRVAVMYLGRIVETGPTGLVLRHPAHPYTQALVSSEPRLARKGAARERIILRGDPPGPSTKSEACVFQKRCWRSRQSCDRQPALETVEETHLAACHFPADSGR